MSSTETIVFSLEAYPRWLVANGLIITIVLFAWLAAKTLKWAIYLLFALMAVGAAVWLVQWCLAPSPVAG